MAVDLFGGIMKRGRVYGRLMGQAQVKNAWAKGETGALQSMARYMGRNTLIGAGAGTLLGGASSASQGRGFGRGAKRGALYGAIGGAAYGGATMSASLFGGASATSVLAKDLGYGKSLKSRMMANSLAKKSVRTHRPGVGGW